MPPSGDWIPSRTDQYLCPHARGLAALGAAGQLKTVMARDSPVSPGHVAIPQHPHQVAMLYFRGRLFPIEERMRLGIKQA